MRSDGDLDSIDFKPFFDMIVGILFILLILISAQMFFAQHGGAETSAAEEAQRRVLERERQVTAFLDDVADRLRAKGLDARVDRNRRAVVLPLAQVTEPARGGVPQFAQGPVGALGAVLAKRLPCVLPAGARPGDCPDTSLLSLGEVQADLRLDGVPPGAVLPPDRYAQLATTLFSATLLDRRPDLLGLTGRAGTPALRVSGLAQGAAADQNQKAPGGELDLVFAFDR